MSRIILCLFIAAGLNSRALAKDLILAASNISADRFVLLVHAEPSKRELIEINSRDLKSKVLPLPAAVGADDIMAIVKDGERLFVVSQYTTGDGKPVRVFSLTKSGWKDEGTIDCVSFTAVKLEKNKFGLKCEENPLTNAAAGLKTLQLKTQAEKHLEFPLPLVKDQNGKASYRLEGALMEWGAVEVRNEKTARTFKSAELLSSK